MRSLGEGGQAHTFVVRDLTSGSEDWVLKRLKNRNRLGRFEREIEALQRLDSSRIPTIADYSVGNPAYIVSRFAGDSLSNLDLRTVPMAERLTLFAHVVQAIQDAHGVGIVHRDIKPNNIVFGAEGAFLIDFGICQIIDDSLVITTVDEAFGNPSFAAPECGQGSEANCGLPSDIYSLGKVLYWIVSNGRFIVRERFDREAEEYIDDQDAWVRRYISGLIRGCVSEDPGGRWTAEELAAIVEEVRRLVDARAESAAQGSIAVWDGFWLGDSFSKSGTRSATQPNRGNPPADGDVASSFAVEVGRDVELRELTLAVAHRAGDRQLEVAVCGDSDGTPLDGAPVETFRGTVEAGGQPQFLRLVSNTRPRLQASQRYWVILSVPEPDTEIAWFGAAPELDGVLTRIAERYDNGRWQAGETRGGLALRVVGALV
jgi:serine/threonine protein kinase